MLAQIEARLMEAVEIYHQKDAEGYHWGVFNAMCEVTKWRWAMKRYLEEV